MLRSIARHSKPHCRRGSVFHYSNSSAVPDNEGYLSRKSEINTKHYPPIYDVRKKLTSANSALTSVTSFRSEFEEHDFSNYPGKRFPDKTYNLEGRISSIRKMGRGMYFIDLEAEKTVQVMASNKLMSIDLEEFENIHQFLRKGDYIAVLGDASRSNVGELSLKLIQPIEILCPRVSELPNKIVDKKIINSSRVMNYLVNPDSRKPIQIKSWIVQSIRQFLLEKDFLEVNTPILAGTGTGANARPFSTTLKGHETEQLLLRVAPELWLKKLIISGFPRVFEIGYNFRNEGVDGTHNPEFTTCEFYRSFIGLEELITMTEEMFQRIHLDVSRKTDVGRELENFAKPFLRYEFIPTLYEKTGILPPSVLNSTNLIAYYKQIGLEVPKRVSPANLLDNLSGIYLESISEKFPNTPVVIFNQPAEMSPLAKSKKITYRGESFDISLRFELFINGREYVNSYEEENSPVEQHSKFIDQQKNKKEFNDDESVVPDWQYIKAMEYGLPPTGGWGCGLDRLAMLFSGSDRIDNVLAFGNLRDVQKQ